MIRRVLGRKQSEDNEKFCHVWQNIDQYVSKGYIDQKIESTIPQIRKVIQNKRVGYAWSGGKDSVALKFFMDILGVEDSVMGMTHDLEYPAFLRYVTNNMPDGLEVVKSGHSLEWLADNLVMLFPKHSNIAAKWFKGIQHNAQIVFSKKNNLDLIILGRRTQDSNHCGPSGSNIYYNKSQRIVRYSPLSDWCHEEIMGLMHYYNLPVSPHYSWVNGWVVGTGCWPARQWTGSVDKGWSEIYSIDPSILETAASKIKSAQVFLNSIHS